MTAPATIKIENEIAILTMDDGKANAINPTMLDALHACLDEAEKNAKVLILTGREGRFSGGFDLRLFASQPAEEVKALVDNGGKLAHRLFSFPMPVIAACNGHGVAMGSFMLLSSDVRIGTAGEFKIGANETQIHMVIPVWAMELIHARVASNYLTRSAIFGELFSPEEAIKAGYLDQVVPADALQGAALAVAEQLKGISGSSLTGNKRLLREDTLAAMLASVPA